MPRINIRVYRALCRGARRRGPAAGQLLHSEAALSTALGGSHAPGLMGLTGVINTPDGGVTDIVRPRRPRTFSLPLLRCRTTSSFFSLANIRGSSRPTEAVWAP